MTVEYQDASNMLSEIGQLHLLQCWEQLDARQRKSLLSQLEKLDMATLRLQQGLLQTEIPQRQISLFDNYASAGDAAEGKKLIAEGRVGCLIVAGGQGTRLRFEGPKGIYPLTRVKKKTPFQLFAEKTVAASKQANYPLLLSIMTSPDNHEETVAYFEKNLFFGLERHQVSFFSQETLPFLDPGGNLFLEAPDRLAVGPDGNGDALRQFVKQGIWDRWYASGVRYLQFLPVDNVLADPFDAILADCHKASGSEVIIKCTQRRDGEENVGILAKEEGRTAVVEYSELSREERMAKNPDGSLRYPLANLSLFSFEMDFIRSIAKKHLPLHKASKAVKSLKEIPMAWKFEKFIFDVLPLSHSVKALVYPREMCFAPLKNFSGSDSIETASAAIEANDRKVFNAITGTECEFSPLEISQEFYYPTPELLAAWRGKTPSKGGYIDAKS